MASFVLIGLLVQQRVGWGDPAFVAIEATVVLFLSIWSTCRLSVNGFWAPAPLFLLVLGVFHFGLVPYWILRLDPVLPRSSDYTWFHGGFAVWLLLLCSIAAASYALGSALVATRRVSNQENAPGFLRPDREWAMAERISDAGAALLVIGLSWWTVASVHAGGWEVLVGPYRNFLDLTQGTGLSDAYYLIGPGLGLALIAPLRGFRIAAVALFVVFAGVAFFLGLRGEVLFPVVVAVSVLAFRRPLPRTRVVLACGVILLTLISAAKIVRQSGVASSTPDWMNASPIAALAELGQSIRVVAVSVMWHSNDGDPFRMGDTYTAFIARTFELVTYPDSRPMATADFRLMNAEVSEKAGAIGGSVIAEAYHNFAVIGVVIVLLLLGMLFGYFSTMRPAAWRIAIFVCLAVPLLNHVRNSFIPVLPASLIGLGSVAIAALIARATEGRVLVKHDRGAQ